MFVGLGMVFWLMFDLGSFLFGVFVGGCWGLLIGGWGILLQLLSLDKDNYFDERRVDSDNPYKY